MRILRSGFDVDSEDWRIYDYERDAPGRIRGFPPVSWEARGGVADSGFVWADDTRWSIDTPEDPPSILALITYRSWRGAGALDLRNAEVSVHLRGDDLDLKGARCFFWALSTIAERHARFHYVSRPLAISPGAWGPAETFVLKNDPALWHRSFSGHPPRPVPLAEVLEHSASYGFSFVGFSQKVTGRLSMDDLVIKIP